jgi:ribonuclease HI
VEVIITFDGAARGNGSAQAKCAIGVFVEQYGNPHNVSRVLADADTADSFNNNRSNNQRHLSPARGVTTNNAAELHAAIAASDVAIAIATSRADPSSSFAHQPTKFIFKGDSRLICVGVSTGTILSYSTEALRAAPNAALWVRLRQNLDALMVMGHSYLFDHIPRTSNVEADELANAALDGRPPRHHIVSPKNPVPIAIEHLRIACEALMRRRRQVLRTLPPGLAPAWNQVLVRIVAPYNEDDGRNFQRERARLLLMLAPHILTLGCGPSIRGRADFTKLRTHLALLQAPTYFDGCVEELYENLVGVQAFSEEQRADPAGGPGMPFHDTEGEAMAAEHRRTRAMAARGLFAQIIKDEKIQLARPTQENIDRVKALYPEAELPAPLQSQARTESMRVPYKVEYAAISRAVRRSKRGKACAFSGWTRELLFPMLATPQLPAIRAAIEGIFRDFITVADLSLAERALLKNGVLVPFLYVETQKVRPITIMEYFLKICFIMLLDDVVNRDARLKASSHTSFLPGGAQLSVGAIVAALEDGRVVFGLDGSNAFNTVARRAAFAHIDSVPQYADLHPLLNFLYCETSEAIWFHGESRTVVNVTAGTRQGCVSGPWFFCCATLHAFRNLGDVEMTQVVDDTYLIGKRAQADFDRVVEALGSIGIKINVEKTRVFGTTHMRRAAGLEPRFEQMGKEQNREQNKKFADPLGAIVEYPPSPHLRTSWSFMQKWAAEGSKKWLTQARSKLQRIVDLNTTKQIKFLTLRSVSTHFIYAASTFHGTFRQALFKELDDAIYAAFLSITGVEDSPDLRVQAQHPLQDRGFGLFPYDLLSDYILSHARARTKAYADTRFHGLHIPLVPAAGGSLSLTNQWRSWTRQQSRTQYAASSQHHVLKTWPTNRFTTLSDEHFEFTVRLLAGCLVPRQYQCPLAGKQLRSMMPKEYTEHVLTCRHCAALGHYHRHEKVNNVIHFVLRLAGVSSNLNPKGYPIPDHTRGGADLFVTTEHVEAVDVSIVRPQDYSRVAAVLRAREVRKLNHYEQYSQLTKQLVVPWVMSAYGEHGLAAIEAAQRWARRSSSTTTKSDLLTFTQMELIRGLAQGIDLLHLRLQPQPVQGFSSTNGNVVRDAFENAQNGVAGVRDEEEGSAADGGVARRPVRVVVVDGETRFVRELSDDDEPDAVVDVANEEEEAQNGGGARAFAEHRFAGRAGV